MKKVILFYITFLMVNLSASEYLKIWDVNNPWYSQNGTIERSTISIKPKGIYTEYGMYFTLSTYGTTFSATDSLEVEMDFNLPVDAEVTDMWLWVGDDIMRADIMDLWTAQQEYDDIVDRRVDPAILKKIAPGEYVISIFPLMVDLPRRIKITYILPNDKTGNDHLRTAALPINIMQLSQYQSEPLHILYWPESSEDIPSINESISFNKYILDDAIQGQYYQFDIFYLSSLSSLNLKYGIPSPESVYGGIYQDPYDGENYYQLEINPKEIFSISSSEKVVFLFDVVEDNITDFEINTILLELKESILTELDSTDSFNIMFSGMTTGVVSNTWLPADSTTVETIFSTISSDNFNNYSSLPTLMIDGISFIRDIQKDETIASIVLISSSNSHGDVDQANALIDDIVALTNNSIPILTIDLDNTSPNMHNIGDIWFKGNEYLYYHLARQTSGEVFSLRDFPYIELLSQTLPLTSGSFSAIDIYTTLTSGFTYSNFDLTPTSGIVYIDRPYKRIGKYTGDLPFQVLASGETSSGDVYNTVITIPEVKITVTDSITKSIWDGQHLRVLRDLEQTNTTISEIIYKSIDYRILSDYTAFLALEPDEDHEPYLGDDEEEYVGINDENLLDSLDYKIYHKNYPNPFNPTTTISYTLKNSADIKLSVFNIYGEIVAVLTDERKNAGKHTVTFDGLSLTSGIYFSALSVNGIVESRNRMVLIK